ncbi:hypothetical protein VIOR3934_06704 [Vibrio orientalis CIP 102891 = ATCC 33934]|uniref:Uncharacterized protein n=1 Tax=Vibrio orientalis CIP 102891 = ATCC 33934 TaxID=675816 RepID=F9SQB5_VIBOR|nr:hypothetical protein VIOR3934_06704 [Vibrio orientalis CIP 102891 = ATCC 33934]
MDFVLSVGIGSYRYLAVNVVAYLVLLKRFCAVSAWLHLHLGADSIVLAIINSPYLPMYIT